MREGLDAPDGGPSGVRMAVFFNDLSSSASAELNQAQAFGGERANVPALAHFCCIELSQPLVRRLTFASRSLRASRFESPQLHQVVRTSGGGFPPGKILRRHKALAPYRPVRSSNSRGFSAYYRRVSLRVPVPRNSASQMPVGLDGAVTSDLLAAPTAIRLVDRR
jgi:hypothetical protein